MYLLLALGAVQCALAWVMGATVHVPVSCILKAAAGPVAVAADVETGL